MTITRGDGITEMGSETRLLKAGFLVLGGLIALAAAVMGLVPLWTIVPLAAAMLLAWGVAEYLSDRPIKT